MELILKPFAWLMRVGYLGIACIRNGVGVKTIRSAVSDEWSEDIFEGQTYTNIIHGDTLHVTVRDHTDVQDDAVLWEIMIPKTEAEHRDLYSEEMAALWQGLK